MPRTIRDGFITLFIMAAAASPRVSLGADHVFYVSHQQEDRPAIPGDYRENAVDASQMRQWLTTKAPGVVFHKVEISDLTSELPKKVSQAMQGGPDEHIKMIILSGHGSPTEYQLSMRASYNAHEVAQVIGRVARENPVAPDLVVYMDTCSNGCPRILGRRFSDILTDDLLEGTKTAPTPKGLESITVAAHVTAAPFYWYQRSGTHFGLYHWLVARIGKGKTEFIGTMTDPLTVRLAVGSFAIPVGVACGLSALGLAGVPTLIGAGLAYATGTLFALFGPRVGESIVRVSESVRNDDGTFQTSVSNKPAGQCLKEHLSPCSALGPALAAVAL